MLIGRKKIKEMALERQVRIKMVRVRVRRVYKISEEELF